MSDFKEQLQGLPNVDFVNKTEPTVDMLDIATQKVVPVPLSQIKEAASSGAFAFKKDQRLPVLDQSGEAGNIPYHQLQDAEAQGFRLPDTGEYLDYAADKVAGDQELKTFGENALSALTFGGSTLAETKALGVDPQAIAARDIANPVASGLGTATGVVGPLLATGGVANIAGAGVKGAAKLGAATEKYVAAQMGKLGAKNAVAQAIATKIAPRIAGSAIEAIPYSMGHLVDETALGSTDVTAENFLATIGTGALVGAGIGGVLGSLEATVPVVSKAFKPIKEKLTSYVDKEKSAAELFGATAAKAKKLDETRPGFWKDSVKDLNEVGVKLTDTTEDIAAKLAAEKEAVGSRIDQIYDQSPTTEAKEVYFRLAKKAEERANSLKNGAVVDPVFTGEYNKLMKLSDDYLNAASTVEKDSNFLTSKDIRSIRQRLDEEINFYKRQPDRPAMQQTMYDLRTELRDILTESAEKAQPGLAKELKSLGQKYGRLSEYGDLLDNKLMKERGLTFQDMLTGGLPFAALPGHSEAAFGLASIAKYANSDLRRKMVILGKLEAANLAVAKTVNNAVKTFYSPIKNLSVPVTSALTSYDLARNSEGKKPKDRIAAFKNIRDNLVEYQTNPEKVAATANKRTMPIYSHAPDTAGFIEAKGAAGLNFLASKLPKRASNVGMMNLFKDNYVPSSMELSKFERYLKAVERPLDTIKELERGTLTREHVEALKAVYPSIYEQLKTEAIDKIQQRPEAISYNKRIQLGILLGVTTDSSLIPEHVLALQASFGQQQPAAEQGVAGTQPNPAAKELDFAGRAENMTEKVQNSDN